MTPERLAQLRKHHKLGCHAVATMADVDGLLAEIEKLKARVVELEARVLEASFAQEAAYLEARETERTRW